MERDPGGGFILYAGYRFYWQQLESRMSQENKAPKVVSIWKFRMAVAAASILLIISLTFSSCILEETGPFIPISCLIPL